MTESKMKEIFKEMTGKDFMTEIISGIDQLNFYALTIVPLNSKNGHVSSLKYLEFITRGYTTLAMYQNFLNKNVDTPEPRAACEKLISDISKEFESIMSILWDIDCGDMIDTIINEENKTREKHLLNLFRGIDKEIIK